MEYWRSKGMDIEHKLKWYIPVKPRERMLRIRQKYKISGCHVCQCFPLYKVLYKLPDINLVEYYCSEHMDKFTT